MTTLDLYNTIIRWTDTYEQGVLFGGKLTDGKKIYANNKMINHYIALAQSLLRERNRRK